MLGSQTQIRTLRNTITAIISYQVIDVPQAVSAEEQGSEGWSGVMERAREGGWETKQRRGR